MMKDENEKAVLRPKDVKNILKIGLNQSYYLFHRRDFPTKRVGRSLFVEREAFWNWLRTRGGFDGEDDSAS